MSVLRRSIPFAALSFALAACSNNGTGGTSPTPTAPSSSQTAAIGSTLTDEISTDASGLSATTAITPAFFTTAGPGSSISAALAGASGCVAPSSTTDTDGDGIYNDATFTFTNPPCSFTNRRGGTVAITGTLRIQDPTTTADPSYNSTLNALAFAYTNPVAAKSYTVTRTGSRNVSVTSGGLGLTSNLTIVRTFTGDSTATIGKAWTYTFTPSAGSTITAGQPLPSGNLAVSGTYNWTRGTESFAITVSTPTPIFYDATCTQPQAFTAGVVRATGTYNGVSGYFRITWVECGTEPTIIFIAA